MFKVIIAGGRDFDNYERLCEVCDYLLKNKTDIQIVTGKAKGVDSLGERYARERGYSVKEFPAKWNDLTATPCVVKTNRGGYEYNALAGHNRNEEMAEYGDALIVFWNGKSSGTKNMIGLGDKYKLQVKTIIY